MAEPTIVFTPSQRPRLDAGDYQVTVELTASPQQDHPFRADATFQVAGERFILAPEAIVAVFPPRGSIGDHSSALPHIVLDRATLPWERDPGEGGEHPPWLALLLFDQDEAPTPRTLPLNGLAQESLIPPAAVAPAAHEAPDDPVTVIDVPTDLLSDLLPPYDELDLLAHTRSADGGDEVAVVVGNRLPAPGGTSTVHLVSLERRYRTTPGAAPVLDVVAGSASTVPMISLASWTFSCVSADHTFAGLVRRLAQEPAPFRLPPSGTTEADAYLRGGAVPVRHRLRDGTRSIAWYRGPLTVGPRQVEVRAGTGASPVRTGDALLSYDGDCGMFDVGNAAAWQLGRLLALQSPDVSTAAYTWRRRRAQSAVRRVPGGYPLAVTGIADGPPGRLVTWLTGLGRLEGVPLAYLVPDERLLPTESIRFVGLDQVWVSHLLDGACSVGRIGRADVALDAMVPPLVSLPTVTGAVIRSEVVEATPGLLVDAFEDVDGLRALTPFRVAWLGPQLLLCLFEGRLARLDLHQPPEGQHLGLEPGTGPTGPEVVKTLRGNPAVRVGPIPLRPRRVVPMRALADATAAVRGVALGGVTSADLAAQLTETAQRVTFLAPRPQV